MRFIDEHRHDVFDGREFGVEPICRVLTEHGAKIAPSTYYAAHGRRPCPRAVRDAELLTRIRGVHEANYGSMGLARCGVNCSVTASRSPGAPSSG